ncbi:type IV pili methyl-accepting chemotaxis transducer N-terminal domain-containing protein [Ideonella livida]|uniref:ANTAR domain-containing protein n=1 Tax=Ideonella livida TaxID=2707176 RepID=A0A7C9PJR3_9BURK|nr:type IV pili methyl-accepting chemotaxis transducer N-terminal domain-containing protein [Ideonella livida]NDY92734.1 ANTAR domain-containing protein [Ideonella livida]
MNRPGAELLILCLADPTGPAAWSAALQAAGVATVRCAVATAAEVQALDRLTLTDAHLVLSGPLDALRQALPALLQAWQGEPPGPLSLFSPEGPPPELPAWVEAGLGGAWPLALRDQPAALAAALGADRARWTREARTRHALRQAQLQLDERKWVERAKGVLLQTQGPGRLQGEDEAFRLLRSAAMQSGLRVGEVSRAVVESAQWAEAINRAGQLRMLSQRLIKLAAQRLVGVDGRRARTLQHQAAERAQDNLDHLARLPALAAPAAGGVPALQARLQATLQAWTALRDTLAERQSPALLALADQHAEALLATAEALTSALEQHGGRPGLRVVNLCGRQRMRVQRLAKAALMAELLAEPARQEALVALLDEFEATLLELERAPLSSAEIRHSLAAARDEWLRLLRGLRTTTGAGFGSPGTDPRAALAGSADALLDLFDQLTAAYEHSLQVLMG